MNMYVLVQTAITGNTDRIDGATEIYSFLTVLDAIKI